MSAAYLLFVRGASSRGRLIAMIAAGLFVLALGAAVGLDADAPPEAPFDLVVTLGFALLIPVVALTYASAALGDPAEDGTLVYLWLRPVARWRLVVSAAAGVFTVVLPLVLVPVAGAALLAGRDASLVLGALAGTAVATAAYISVFLGLGLIVQRSFFWGLLYVFVWEGAVSSVGGAAARGSVRLYAQALLADLSGRPMDPLVPSLGVAVAAPLAVAALALALVLWRLARMDIR